MIPASLVLTEFLRSNAGILVAIGLLSLVYGIGLRRLWSSAGQGHGVKRLESAAFTCGVIVIAIALLSPIDGLADRLQFMHMVQHLLLIIAAPPLLILGRPLRTLAWALPMKFRARRLSWLMKASPASRIASFISGPAVAFTVHALMLVFWHLPRPYDAAVANEGIHALEHLSFLGSALLFWWVLMAPRPMQRLQPIARVPYVFGMSLIGAGIGAVLTFASSPLYDAYLASTPAFGITALDDQQLAGLIMWVLGGIAYLIAAAIFFARALEGRDAAKAALVPFRSTESFS